MMHTVETNVAVQPQRDCVALKDQRLIYRACSMAYANSLGFDSPSDIIGRTDLDLLPEHVARHQMSLDEQTLRSAKADISTIRLGESANQSEMSAAMIVRSPVVGEGDVVKGIDIRLVGGPVNGKRRSAITVDYELLVKEGLQGSLILNEKEVLFANEAAAKTLGFDSVSELQNSVALNDIFSSEQLVHLNRVAVSEATDPARTLRARVTARRKDGHGVRLITRAAFVNWGATQATLLSFIDMGPAAEQTHSVGATAYGAASSTRAPASSADRMRQQLDLLQHDVQSAASHPASTVHAEIPDHSAGQTQDKISEQLSRRFLEQTSGQTPKRISEQNPEQISEQISERISEQTAEQTVEQTVEQIPEQFSGRFPEQTSEGIPKQPADQTADANKFEALTSSAGLNQFSAAAVGQSDIAPVRSNLDATPTQNSKAVMGGNIGSTTGLAEVAQRYHDFVRATADCYWELDERLVFRMVSKQVKNVLGLSSEQLVGRSFRQWLEMPSNVNDEGHWDEHLLRLGDHQPFRDVKFRWMVDGETRVFRYSGMPVYDATDKFKGYRATLCDVTSSVRKTEAIEYHANHDALTGLLNRRAFETYVQEALQESRNSRAAHAMCFMDLDGFKAVNDTSGHEAGDELLRQLAQLFDSLVRKSDVLARLGGDEFGVFLYNCKIAEAIKLANQIRHEVENFEFPWDEHTFSVGVSIGLVVVDDRWEDMEAVFRAADAACYIAKDEGRNRVVVYREGSGHTSNRKVATQWVEEINSALEQDRFRLAAQKIMPLDDQPDGVRFEVLSRLELPNGSIVSPSSFYPAAERYGLSAALDRRAIELTIRWLSQNEDIRRELRHVSINLSSGSITNPDFAQWLINQVNESPLRPEQFCFELGETATVANLSAVSTFMNELTAIGCRFSIDHFGSGLSSFGYLRKLPVDFLKIDGFLIRDILDDPTDLTMVKAICDITRSMGKRTVAEHIESPRLMNAVRDAGADFVQGIHVGEPELVTIS